MSQVMLFGFHSESFKPVDETAQRKNFPIAELLARFLGKSAEGLFKTARTLGRIVQTDVQVFELAVARHILLDQPVSINLNAETIFSDELAQSIQSLIIKYPKIDFSMICLEITEQGGVPQNYDSRKLDDLKGLGFKLALDDYNPLDTKETQRLNAFAPHVDIVKFPFQILEALREGSLTKEHVMGFTQSIRHLNSNVIVILEGFRETDVEYSFLLKDMGINYVQMSSYKPVNNAHLDSARNTLPTLALS